jgi:hypothetical protein
MTHSWTESHVFSPYYYQSNGRFGFSVELSGEYAIIGSPGYDKRDLLKFINWKMNHGKNNKNLQP